MSTPTLTSTSTSTIATAGNSKPTPTPNPQHQHHQQKQQQLQQRQQQQIKNQLQHQEQLQQMHSEPKAKSFMAIIKTRCDGLSCFGQKNAKISQIPLLWLLICGLLKKIVSLNLFRKNTFVLDFLKIFLIAIHSVLAERCYSQLLGKNII